MLFDQPATLEPDDVLDWHALCSAGLARERIDADLLLESATRVPEYLSKNLPVGSTKLDIDQFFKLCQQELDLCTVLTLIAAAEARVRLDMSARLNKGKADFLATRFRELRSRVEKEWNVPLYDDGILDAWKTYVGTLGGWSQKDRGRQLSAIGGLKAALPVRHWAAHGRYWQIKRDIQSYPPIAVARTIEALYVSLREIANYGGLMAFA